MRDDGAGNLDQRVALYDLEEAQDAGGHPVPGERLVRKLWAKVTAVGGGEFRRGTQIEAGVTTLVRIWHRDDVTPRMWFLHRGKRLNIVRTYDETGRRVFTDCQCKQVD